LDIKVSVNRRASAKIDRVALYSGPALLTLDVNTIGVARNYFVVLNDHFVLRSSLNHDSARFEMLKVALFDLYIGINGDKTSRASIVGGVTLELAVIHLD